VNAAHCFDLAADLESILLRWHGHADDADTHA
jgi:hypothetical protein